MSGGTLIVDPQRDPRPYLAAMERRGLAPRFVAETHARRFRLRRSGAGRSGRGAAGPGRQRSGVPASAAARQTEPLARAAYRSIRQRLLTLPGDLAVYPTHGGGSLCSAGRDGHRTTTIGQERTANPLIADDADEDTFVARLLAGLGSYPAYFLELRAVNRAGPPVHGRTPRQLSQLGVGQTNAALAECAALVDVRSIDAFAAAHLPDALSIPWRTQFATWLGWLVPRTRPVVFVADDTVDRDDLVWAARTGELAGGIRAWTSAGQRLARTPWSTPQTPTAAATSPCSPAAARTSANWKPRSEPHLPVKIDLVGPHRRGTAIRSHAVYTDAGTWHTGRHQKWQSDSTHSSTSSLPNRTRSLWRPYRRRG